MATHSPHTQNTSLPVAVLPPWVDQTEYPFVPRRFVHPEGALHYVDEGDGPVLLFVHGTPSWSFEWRRAISVLRARYRCVAVDHLGFGLSEKPHDGAYLPAAHTRRLHDFIRALDLSDVTLVAHDFGGPIALPLVVRDPQRFRQVIAVNTWAWPIDSAKRGRRLMRLVRSPLGRFLYLSCNASPRWLLPASFANKTRLTGEVHRHYLEPFQAKQARLAPWTLGANLVDGAAFAPEFGELLEPLRLLRTAVIWGQRDRLIGLEVLSQWKRALPEAHFTLLEDSGHFPQEESPGAFIQALEQAISPDPR